MSGDWSVTRNAIAPVHTFTAPDDGWCVTSHIIELCSQLIIVDAQYRLDYAGEVAAYARALRKPVTRLYLTHYHPDHILGAAAIGAPIYSLDEVAAKIKAVGDRIAGEEREKAGVAMPDH